MQQQPAKKSNLSFIGRYKYISDSEITPGKS